MKENQSQHNSAPKTNPTNNPKSAPKGQDIMSAFAKHTNLSFDDPNAEKVEVEIKCTDMDSELIQRLVNLSVEEFFRVASKNLILIKELGCVPRVVSDSNTERARESKLPPTEIFKELAMRVGFFILILIFNVGGGRRGSG